MMDTELIPMEVLVSPSKSQIKRFQETGKAKGEKRRKIIGPVPEFS